MVKFGVSIYSISRKIISEEMTPEAGIKWLAENGAEAIELVPFGSQILVGWMFQYEIQSHNLVFDRGGLVLSSIAVVRFPQGSVDGLGRHMKNHPVVPVHGDPAMPVCSELL